MPEGVVFAFLPDSTSSFKTADAYFERGHTADFDLIPLLQCINKRANQALQMGCNPHEVFCWALY